MTAIGFVIIVLVSIVGYLLGSINLSIILSKLMGKGDIRDYGSKNAGTTNTLRVLGKGPALLVFIWDVLKGSLAVCIARWVVGWLGSPDATEGALFDYNLVYSLGIMITSIAVILGHNYPAFFGFKGGKGVATSLGVILAIECRIGLICLAVGVVGIAIFQFVSVGSLIAAIEYPILICIIGGHFDRTLDSTIQIRIMYIVFSFILSLMIVYRHRANIERIKNGTENKLKFRKTAEEKIAEQKEKLQGNIDSTAEDVEQTVKEIKNEVIKDAKEEISDATEKVNEVAEKVSEKATKIREDINKDDKVDVKVGPKKNKKKK